jgi:hypothetical protein
LFEGGDAFFAAPLAGAAERIAAMAIRMMRRGNFEMPSLAGFSDNAPYPSTSKKYIQTHALCTENAFARKKFPSESTNKFRILCKPRLPL